MFLLVPAYPGCPGSKAVKRSGRGCFFANLVSVAVCSHGAMFERYVRLFVAISAQTAIYISCFSLFSFLLRRFHHLRAGMWHLSRRLVLEPRGVPMPRLGLVGQRMCLGLDRLSASCTFLGLPAATSTVTYKQYGVK